MRSNDFTPTLILPHQGGGEVFCRLPADEYPNPSPCRRGLFSRGGARFRSRLPTAPVIGVTIFLPDFSLGLDAGNPDHLCPFLYVLLQERPKLLRPASDRHGPLGAVGCPDRGP